MNRLIITYDNICLYADDKISLKEETEFLSVKSLNIKVKESTDLIIEGDVKDIKLSITINVLKGVHLNIFELKKGDRYKIRYLYYLSKNSELNIQKINDVREINEEVIFNLNGENSKVDFNLKTISKNREKYNFLVYHNAKKTISNINNNGVNILDGSLEFNVSSFVPNGVIKCDASQSARIINETSNECIVKPNLFIDEEDVIANHSAYIGNFNEEELFYLMSRGIEEEEARRILCKGFLIKGITHHKDIFEKIIDKYWG